MMRLLTRSLMFGSFTALAALPCAAQNEEQDLEFLARALRARDESITSLRLPYEIVDSADVLSATGWWATEGGVCAVHRDLANKRLPNSWASWNGAVGQVVRASDSAWLQPGAAFLNVNPSDDDLPVVLNRTYRMSGSDFVAHLPPGFGFAYLNLRWSDLLSRPDAEVEVVGRAMVSGVDCLGVYVDPNPRGAGDPGSPTIAWFDDRDTLLARRVDALREFSKHTELGIESALAEQHAFERGRWKSFPYLRWDLLECARIGSGLAVPIRGRQCYPLNPSGQAFEVTVPVDRIEFGESLGLASMFENLPVGVLVDDKIRDQTYCIGPNGSRLSVDGLKYADLLRKILPADGGRWPNADVESFSFGRSSCGPAALLLAGHLHGFDWTPETIQDQISALYPESSQVSLQMLAETARALGLHARAVAMSLDDLRRFDGTAIVHIHDDSVDYSHFAVARPFGARVQLASPPHKIEELGEPLFMEHWTRHALLVDSKPIELIVPSSSQAIRWSAVLLGALCIGLLIWRFGQTRRLAGACVFAVVALGFTACGTESPDAVVVPVGERAFDAGPIKCGQLVEHTFQFRNAAAQSLKILRARRSCTCAAVRILDDVVEPGQIGRVRLAVDTSGRDGVLRATAAIEADGFEQPVISFGIRMVIGLVHQVEILPSLIELGTIESGHAHKAEAMVKIRARGGEQLGVLAAAEFQGRRGLTVVPVGEPVSALEPDWEVRNVPIEIRLPKSIEPGRFRDEVELTVDCGDLMLRRRLVVSADVRGGLDFETPSVFLGKVRAGVTVERAVRCARASECDPADVQVVASSRWITASLRSRDDSDDRRPWELVVRCEPNKVGRIDEWVELTGADGTPSRVQVLGWAH